MMLAGMCLGVKGLLPYLFYGVLLSTSHALKEITSMSKISGLGSFLIACRIHYTSPSHDTIFIWKI